MGKKYTYEDVKHYIEMESGSDCILLSKTYKDNKTKLEVKCKCGEIFNVSYYNFKNKNKRQCNTCSGVKRYTYLEVKQYIEIFSESGCILLSTSYNGVYDKLNVQCKCENEFIVHFSDFKNAKKVQCNKCSGWNRHTHEDVKHFIENESNSGCVLLSEEYISVNDKLEIRCKCGDIFRTDFNHFKGQNKRQCNKCSGTYRRNTETFKEDVAILVGEDYTILSRYIDIDTHVNIRHNVCNYEWSVIPDNFLHKASRCPKCAGVLRKETNQFIQEVFELVGEEYTVLGEYINSKTNIIIKHNECGYEWNVISGNFLTNGRRCPQCSESKGETSVREVLEKNDINYIKENTFDGLIGVGGNPLRFDFYLPDHNICIEYDGEFHFKKFYEDQNFDTLQIHDKRKNQYCKDNNIPLIRIPYWQFDKIEQILDKWLNKYGLIHNEDIKGIA